MNTILALLTSTAGITSIVIPLAAWCLGQFSGSGLFKSIETRLSMVAGKAGQAVSDFGKAKLGAAIANPLEDVAAALIGRPIAQFFVKLRADNPVKLGKELEYLGTVGSQTRAKGIAEKLEALGAAPKPIQDATDAGIAFRTAFTAKESINEKLEGQ
jgi:hypothetical protein